MSSVEPSTELLDKVSKLKNLLEGGNHRPEQNLELILKFYELLLIANESQNLTRLIEPEDFYQGHWIDVFELSKIEFEFPALDLGSGCGVPGLLHGLWQDESNWTLVEAEKSKAQFLRDTVDALGLRKRIKVIPGRMEDKQKMLMPATVLTRATGPIDRIYSWISKCSTWNKIILFKGPKWDEERQKLNTTKDLRTLIIEKEHRYSFPPYFNDRRIVVLRSLRPRAPKSEYSGLS